MVPATSPFVHADVSHEVAAAIDTVEGLDRFHGEATVAGYTVLHGRDVAPRGVALLDTPAGHRVLATTDDQALIAHMQDQEWVGRRLRVTGTTLTQADMI